MNNDINKDTFERIIEIHNRNLQLSNNLFYVLGLLDELDLSELRNDSHIKTIILTAIRHLERVAGFKDPNEE